MKNIVEISAKVKDWPISQLAPPPHISSIFQTVPAAVHPYSGLWAAVLWVAPVRIQRLPALPGPPATLGEQGDSRQPQQILCQHFQVSDAFAKRAGRRAIFLGFFLGGRGESNPCCLEILIQIWKEDFAILVTDLTLEAFGFDKNTCTVHGSGFLFLSRIRENNLDPETKIINWRKKFNLFTLCVNTFFTVFRLLISIIFYREDVEKLAERYKTDFQMFGYSVDDEF